jgi:hypothetical protein
MGIGGRGEVQRRERGAAVGRRWMVSATRAEREAGADVEVAASDLRQLAGSHDCWDQAAMSATSARSTA